MAYIWGKLCLYAGGFGGLLVTFNPTPFAEGSTKQSHEAYYGNEDVDNVSFNKYGQKAVVKKLKNIDKSPLSIKKSFENEIRTHKITASYASKWNQLQQASTSPASTNSKINVNIPYITQINKTNKLLAVFGQSFSFLNRYNHSNGEYITVEDYLDGKFTKFNSNTGWTLNEDKNPISKYLNAFSHWTYHQSNGKHLICDLQGVHHKHSHDGDTTHSHNNNHTKNECEYKLTDPVIMSNNKEFGVTDLGVIGISNWFYYHKCNEYCNPQWIKPEKIEKCDDIECERETSHSMDIIEME